MADLSFALPLIAGLEDDFDAFLQQVQVERRDEHFASRRRLGIELERAYIQDTPTGQYVIVHLEGPGAEQFLRSLGRSTDEYDRWYLERMARLHGVDPADVAQQTQLGFLVQTDLPRSDESTAFCVPLPHDQVEAWWDFVLECNGIRRDALYEARRRLGIHKEVAFLQQTPEGPIVVVYFEGISRPPIGHWMKSTDPFDAWFLDRASRVHAVDIRGHIDDLRTKRVLDWVDTTRRKVMGASLHP